ncbi:MAG: hypothetical protein WC349_00405 [Patescibacteria group bacterium]|jgi:hypothetical protein
MKSGFSIINIIIIIGLITLGYLGYTQYLDNKTEKVLNNLNNESINEQTPITATSTEEKIVQPKITAQENQVEKINATAQTIEEKGFYKNNAYFYQISYPTDWPIKIRSEENVSFGTVPPKNGQGAITIEVTRGESNEINQAKAEAKKYPGIISITEELITLSGINGDKITINNLVTKTKSVNILLKKSNLNYIIKYSEESPEFLKQVNETLTTFKFNK